MIFLLLFYFKNLFTCASFANFIYKQKTAKERNNFFENFKILT